MRRHDVIAMAERRARNIVKTDYFEGCRCCYDPNSDGGEYQSLIDYKQQHPIQEDEEDEPKEHANSNNDEEEEEDNSDDEFDYLLDEVDLSSQGDHHPALKELEDHRRAELEFHMLSRQVAVHHGYGTHRQLHPGRVLKCAGLGNNPSRDPPPAVVLHLVDPESTSSASLDYFLETQLSKANPGTVFLRSGGRTTLTFDAPLAQKAFPQISASDVPCLLAIKDGVVVHSSPKLRDFTREEDGPVDTHAVEHWLDRCGVLLSNPPRMEYLCYIRPEEDALMDYLATQKPKEVVEEERYDCGLESCSKTFRHEHVGIKTSEQSGLVVKEETVLGGDEQE